MNTYHLDYSLLSASEANSWTWDVRHAVEGVQIFGGIGSGKTSGSGRSLALRYLKAGFGGLVLTVKPDEKADWIEYCKLSGRLNDLIILEPGGKENFNFLEYESKASDSNRALTENIVDVLKTVIKAGEKEGADNGDNAFWENALDMLLFNVIDLCKLAYGKVTIDHLYNIVQSLPKPIDSKKAKPNESTMLAHPLGFNTTYKAAQAEVSKIVDTTEAATRLRKNYDEYELSDEEIYAIPEVRLFQHIDQFFTDTFRNLSEKTRAIIEFTFTGFLFRLMREPIYSLFSGKTSTFSPDDCGNGKIIIVNLPVKVFHKVGRDCQILFKYIWQRAMEKRKVSPENTRPVFLWADEAQNFLHEHDAVYQATARSSKIATVYITQNLPNYYAAMGGEKAEYRVKSFLGTLGTKIFHSNADIETNKYASELIGDEYKEIETSGISTGSESFTQSRNKDKRLERIERPESFVAFKSGGKKNNYKVQCVVHRQGEPFVDGRNHHKMIFSQL